jgi:hypothetical protein
VSGVLFIVRLAGSDLQERGFMKNTIGHTHITCRPCVTRALREGYGSMATGFDLVWEGWARWRNVNCYSHSQRGAVVLRSNLRLTSNLCWHTMCARVSGGVVFCMTQSQFPVCLRRPYVVWLWRNCQGGWGRQHNLQMHTVFCGLSEALTWVNMRCGDRVQMTKCAKRRCNQPVCWKCLQPEGVLEAKE